MTIRLTNATMIAGTVLASILCYTVSLRISTERSAVEDLQRQIAADTRDVRSLEAELRTRARLPVLQHWNDNVLALGAPLPKQFVDSPVQLASYAPGAPATALAAVDTPSAPAPAAPSASGAPQPQYAVAGADAPRIAPAAAPLQAIAYAPVVRPEPKPVAKPAESAAAAPVRTDAAARAKPAKPAKTADPLGALIEQVDTAAAKERSTLRKVAMQ